jgi:hypothetical protein
LVQENQEEEENASAFFERGGRRAFGSSPVSGLKTLNTPESVMVYP